MKTNLLIRKVSIFLIGILAVVLITNCNKTDNTTPQPGKSELSFNILAGKDPSGLKDGGTPGCIDANKSGNYVNVQISTGNDAPVTYRLDVFYIGDVPYTNTIKLPVGSYKIEEFVMMNDGMPNTTTPTVLAAAVHSDANYADLISSDSRLDKNFTIEPFTKNTMDIELVCYDEAHYEDFGFQFFNLNQTIIREQVFFGDICITDVDDYNGTHSSPSPYADKLGPENVLLDLTAIFKIEVFRNGDFIGTYNNESIPGLAQPLKIQYVDPIGTIDHFEFKLYILVRQGAGFAYVYFDSWTFDDGVKIPSGSDGVVDFVLGDCMPDADFVIPPVNPPTPPPPPPPPPQGNCEVTKSNGGGFSTTIQSVVCNNDGNEEHDKTYTIVLRVVHDGCPGPTCKELSHYSVEADHETYSDVSVHVISGSMTYDHDIEMGYELGNSTPFDGFKIDGTKKIGDGHAGSFTITYTLTSLQDQQVSAKAGQNAQIASFTADEFASVMNCNQTNCH